MKKLGFILLFFQLSGYLTFAQGGWKKKFILQNSTTSTSRNVIEAPNGNLITIGITVDTINNKMFNRLTLIGTSGNGNYLWRKDYGGLKFIHLNNAYAQKAAIYKDGNVFYYSGVVQDTALRTVGVLMKFNFNGDTLWQKIYRDQIEDLIPQGLTKSVDGGFLITGEFQNWTSSATPCMILKTDANGKELWRKKIHKATQNFILGNGITQDTATKKIVITGYQTLNSTSAINLLITDSLGNKITQSTLNNPGGGGALDLIQLRDKNFLTCGAYTKFTNGSDNYVQGYVVKFDIYGTIIWSKKFYNALPQNGFSFAKELNNGDLVILGTLDTNFIPNKQYMLKPILMCLDKNGNYLSHKYIGTSFESGIDEFANSLNATADGGFILSTQFPYMHNPTPYSIIKVDSTFCDTTTQWCVSVALGLDKFNALTGYKFEMFPNPVKDVLNLNLQQSQSSDAVILKIMDVSGREIETTFITPNENTQLNTSNYAPGIYFVNIIYEGRTVDTRKLFIER